MFRFAILGAGKIAVKFADAVRRAGNAEVVAVGSRSAERAAEFARQNGIPRSYGDYRTLLETEKPDCAYIATIPATHFALCMLCASLKIPVICEKAMFRDSREAETAFSEAKQQGIFMMEALWSKFLPASQTARRWLREGRIGTPVLTDCSIGFRAPKEAENRYFSPSLGGGAALDITCYAYEITAFMLGMEPVIDNVTVVPAWTGVDGAEVVTMHAGDVISTLRTSFLCPLTETLTINGSHGSIVIPRPHVAKEAFLYDDKGALTEHFVDEGEPNGFVHEVREVMACVQGGALESRTQSAADTIACARLFDTIHSLTAAQYAAGQQA